MGEIRIDKEGFWYFHGIEMKRFEIVKYLYGYLKKDDQGRYLIEIGNDRCYVNVEDAPFVVKSVDIDSIGNEHPPSLNLSDGSKEVLDSKTSIWIGAGNVLYCNVKNGQYPARFSRPAYYEISRYIEYDSDSDQYFLRWKNGSKSDVIKTL